MTFPNGPTSKQWRWRMCEQVSVPRDERLNERDTEGRKETRVNSIHFTLLPVTCGLWWCMSRALLLFLLTTPHSGFNQMICDRNVFWGRKQYKSHPLLWDAASICLRWTPNYWNWMRLWTPHWDITRIIIVPINSVPDNSIQLVLLIWCSHEEIEWTRTEE